MSEVEDTLTRIKTHKSVQGIVIVNNEGRILRSTYANTDRREEGENIATTQGVVATTALGAAMKALPIIAIVAALGTLAYGLYQYATASSEAEQNEKRRVATLKAQREEQEKQNETIAKESAGYVSLILQLKATNAGSKERTTLIKQINAKITP